MAISIYTGHLQHLQKKVLITKAKRYYGQLSMSKMANEHDGHLVQWSMSRMDDDGNQNE